MKEEKLGAASELSHTFFCTCERKVTSANSSITNTFPIFSVLRIPGITENMGASSHIFSYRSEERRVGKEC